MVPDRTQSTPWVIATRWEDPGVAKMVTQEHVIRFVIVGRLNFIIKLVIRFAIVGRLHYRTKVKGNTSIALSSLAGRAGRLVNFVKLSLEADRTLIDLGGDRQLGYLNSVLGHVTDTARNCVSKM
jgi:hypothetical protein